VHFDIGNNSNFVNAELFPSPLILFCFVSFVLVLFFAVDSLPAVLQCFCCIGLLAAVVFLLYVEGCQRDFVSAICSLICQPKGFPSPLLSRLFFSYFLLYFRQFAIESHHDFWHLASPFAFLRTWLADFTFVAWEWESSR